LVAIRREKQLKGWKRERKIALIEKANPQWKDLSRGWYDKPAKMTFSGVRDGGKGRSLAAREQCCGV
jgi:hypothetical protein